MVSGRSISVIVWIFW